MDFPFLILSLNFPTTPPPKLRPEPFQENLRILEFYQSYEFHFFYQAHNLGTQKNNGYRH